MSINAFDITANNSLYCLCPDLTLPDSQMTAMSPVDGIKL